MTNEEFFKRRCILFEKERHIKKEILSLKRLFICELPFKVGDKIHVENYGSFILGDIDVANYGCKLNLKVFPKKKSGGYSLSYRRLWNIDIDEIVKDE